MPPVTARDLWTSLYSRISISICRSISPSTSTQRAPLSLQESSPPRATLKDERVRQYAAFPR